MELEAARKLALELMAKHLPVPAEPWIFEFDNARKRFGVCRLRSRVISLSAPLTLLNSAEQVEDTIRHEIAHALAGRETARRGNRLVTVHHGEKWKRMCAVTGANPKRCYDTADVNVVEGTWRATCPGCGRVYHRHVAPKSKRGRRFACPACCKEQNAGRFTEEYLLVFRHKDGRPADTAEPVDCPVLSAAAEADRRAQVEFTKGRLREMERMRAEIARLEKKLG